MGKRNPVFDGSRSLSQIFGEFQVGLGTKRGAEVAAHLFRKLIEHDNNQMWSFYQNKILVTLVLLKGEAMLNQSFLTRSGSYKYILGAYSKMSYFIMEYSSLC